jgi:ribose transport system permease protein
MAMRAPGGAAVSDASASPRLAASFNLIDFLRPLRHAHRAAAAHSSSTCFTRNFATLQTLNVNLTQVCTIVIVATGMTLVIATGGIDLSVGSMMAIAGRWRRSSSSTRCSAATWRLPLRSPCLAIVAATLCGLFNGWLVARIRIQPIVATLVLFIAGRGIAQAMTNSNLQVFSVPQLPVDRPWRPFGIPRRSSSSALVIAAAWLLRRTRFGRSILATGGNENARRACRHRGGSTKLAVYAISGFCAGVAGLVVIAINSASDANLVGLGMELDAIAAVAVGGTLLSRGQGNDPRHAASAR